MGRLWVGYGSIVGRNHPLIRIRLPYGRYGIRVQYAYSDSTAIRVLDGAPFPIRVKHLLRLTAPCSKMELPRKGAGGPGGAEATSAPSETPGRFQIEGEALIVALSSSKRP